MRTRTLVRPFVGLLLTLHLGGCATAHELDEPPVDDTAPTAPAGERVEVDDGKLDDGGDVRVRADGLTVWIDPAIDARDEDGAPRFVISGRASRDLESVSATIAGDAADGASARVVSARRFEVELGAAEMSDVTFGRPLWIGIAAARAPHPRYVVEVRARARIGAGSGEREIRLASALSAVLVEGEVRYRGLVTLGEGIFDVRLSAPVAGEVPLVDDEDGGLRFDLPFVAVARAAAVRWDRLVLEGRRRLGTVRRTASTALSVSEIAITHLDPVEAWPAESCDAAVRACLEVRGGIAGDTSECGGAWQVALCGGALDAGPEPAGDDLSARFARDLQAHLAEWYAISGEDVRLAGGATLEEAQAAVDVALVVEITDPEEDPWAHDLARTRVLSHPDVVFADSDRSWMGAYQRESGELLDIYSFE